MVAKATQAGRLRGPGAAGGADPGTTNTTAAETAESAVVAEGAAPAAPEGFSELDAPHVVDEGSASPVGGRLEFNPAHLISGGKWVDAIAAQEGVLPPGVEQPSPDWLAIAEAAHQAAIAGTVEEMADDPAPGIQVGGFVVTHLRVVSKAPEGFRRCGRHWGPVPVDVDADEFTEEEILRLLGEPELIVAAVTGSLAPLDE